MHSFKFYTQSNSLWKMPSIFPKSNQNKIKWCMGKDLCTRYKNRNEKESAQNVALRDWSWCFSKLSVRTETNRNLRRWHKECQEPSRAPRGLNECTDREQLKVQLLMPNCKGALFPQMHPSANLKRHHCTGQAKGRSTAMDITWTSNTQLSFKAPGGFL